jgi:ribosome-associated protein
VTQLTDTSTLEKAQRIAGILEAKRAEEIRILDISHLTNICDIFVICSGTSQTHTRALAQEVLDQMGGKRVRAPKLEGFAQGSWILLDYDDVVVHVFLPETREFYGVEEFWSEAGLLRADQVLSTRD